MEFPQKNKHIRKELPNDPAILPYDPAYFRRKQKHYLTTYLYAAQYS